jgi:hypothetical protein
VGNGLKLRHFVPMFFVLSIILLGIASIVYSYFTIILAIDILFYTTTAIYFAFKISIQKKVSFLHVIWSYFILHIAYGFGSVCGVLTFPFKFPNRGARKIGEVIADRK